MTPLGNTLEDNIDTFTGALLLVLAGVTIVVLLVGIAVVASQDRARARRISPTVRRQPVARPADLCMVVTPRSCQRRATHDVNGWRMCEPHYLSHVGHDWHATNFEGHAPIALPWGSSGRYVPACADGCIDAADDGVLAHLERADAVAQAAHILAGRIHGPTDRETRR